MEPKPAGMPHRNQIDMEGSPERGNAWLHAPPAQDADISTSALVSTEAVCLWQVFMPNRMHVCRQGKPWVEWRSRSCFGTPLLSALLNPSLTTKFPYRASWKILHAKRQFIKDIWYDINRVQYSSPFLFNHLLPSSSPCFHPFYFSGFSFSFSFAILLSPSWDMKLGQRRREKEDGEEGHLSSVDCKSETFVDLRVS